MQAVPPTPPTPAGVLLGIAETVGSVGRAAVSAVAAAVGANEQPRRAAAAAGSAPAEAAPAPSDSEPAAVSESGTEGEAQGEAQGAQPCLCGRQHLMWLETGGVSLHVMEVPAAMLVNFELEAQVTLPLVAHPRLSFIPAFVPNHCWCLLPVLFWNPERTLLRRRQARRGALAGGPRGQPRGAGGRAEPQPPQEGQADARWAVRTGLQSSLGGKGPLRRSRRGGCTCALLGARKGLRRVGWHPGAGMARVWPYA